MKAGESASRDERESAASVPALLQRLDLATEVLEGLDELGVLDREELIALMERLEQQIADEDPV